jgi:hypothetical protein
MVTSEGGESGSRRSEFGRNDNDDDQTAAPSTLALIDKQRNHNPSLQQSHPPHSPLHPRQINILDFESINTSQHPSWNKAEQSTR